MIARPADATAEQDAEIMAAQRRAAGYSATSEIEKAQQLLASGAITQAEFDAIKQRALAQDFVMNPLFLTTFLEVIGFIMWAAFWVFVIWIFIWVFGDIFRRRDLSGWGKAGWIFFVFILPIIGALVYIGTRPKYMEDLDPDIAWAPAAGAMSPQRRSPTPRNCWSRAPSPRPNSTRSSANL